MTAGKAKLSTIGKPMAMTDARTKIVGLGKYADDFSVPGMLVGRILHSPYPHARILSIDASRAETLPGVKGVATGKDAPTPYGILPIGHDECVFAVDKVRYIGDNVAAVAATSAEVAEQALDLIRVEYAPLPAWFDPEESMKARSDWIHDSRANNIEKEYHHVFGDPEAGFRAADFVAEERYFAGEVNHAAMEPHATLAIWEPDDRMTVYSSTQVPYYLHRTLSEVCELPMNRIRVIKPLIGSGFGGKSEVIPLEIAAGVLAKKTKKPVKITYTREEVFYAHRGRPRTIVHLKTGHHARGKDYVCAGARNPGRRSVLWFWAGDGSLFWGAARRDLRHSECALRRLPRPHEQACLRRHARAWNRQRAICLRVHSRPVGATGGPRSRRCPPQESAQGSLCYGERPARHQLWPS